MQSECLLGDPDPPWTLALRNTECLPRPSGTYSHCHILNMSYKN